VALGVLRLSGFFTEPALSDDEIHRVTGEPDRYAARAVPDTLTVVSWNIAYGRKCDRHADVLASLDPDVCLLQEVDVGCRRSGFRNVGQSLAERLQMNWLFGGEFQEIGQGRRDAAALTGQAILSRHPITAPSVIPFSHQARWRWRASPIQPRRGARMALCAQTAGLRLYNAHIESGKNDAFRRKQLADIAVHEDDVESGRGPVVIAGDFNFGRFGYASMFDVLHERGFTDALDGDPGTRRTTLRNHHAIDWVMVRGVTVLTAAVGANHAGSDHYPVWAKVRASVGA
jgi:endonuclease/exonuclease/phosphatase family metal-dependent hydrolase